MTVSLPAQDRGALAFGEKILTLLDTGSFTATYKYAVLLALVDLCLEHSSRSGAAPNVLTTRQLAEKVLEVYWPHTVPFAGGGEDRILRQNTTGQAEIVSLIQRFRERGARNPMATLAESRAVAPEGFRRLVDHIEWKLVEMPLPRLQMFGNRHDPFIYQIAWDGSIRQRDMRSPDFDNRLHLLDGAGDHLVRLAGLLEAIGPAAVGGHGVAPEPGPPAGFGPAGVPLRSHAHLARTGARHPARTPGQPLLLLRRASAHRA